jgi:Bacterial SH3 domain
LEKFETGKDKIMFRKALAVFLLTVLLIGFSVEAQNRRRCEPPRLPKPIRINADYIYWGYCNVGNTYVFTEADAFSKRRARITCGTIFKVLGGEGRGRKERWLLVELKNGTQGYVWEDYVSYK